jgi:type VI secretion system protein ImpF
MAEAAPSERLQPALLDRLTDNEPTKRVESRDERVLSVPELRAGILRDLTWLLNAVHLSASEDLSAYPEVEKSVLNFGIPGFAGRTMSQIEIGEAQKTISEAILRFEPRLIPESLKVKLISESLRDETHNVIAVAIEAQLWAQPVPLALFLRTDMDLEIGAVRIREQSETEVTRNTRRRS